MIASIATLLAAITAAVGNISQKCNFSTLNKYPSWIFYVAWTILFILLAIAGEILWRNKLYVLFVIFLILLVILALYPWIQWHLCSRKLAYYMMLLSAILAIILLISSLFYTLAGILFIPLIAWLAFALYISMDSIY